MAKEHITGLVIRKDLLEWSTLLKGKERSDVVASERAALEEDIEQRKASLAGVKGEVTVGLGSEQILLRVVSLPIVEDDELASISRLQVDKFSPFPVESMVVSHEVLHKSDDNCLVLIGAARDEIVQALGKTLNDAGISPARVDADVLGWWRLLADASEIAEKGLQVILLMDGATTELIVLQDGIPMVFRSLGSNEGMTEEELAVETASEVGHTLMSLELEYGSADTSTVSVWTRGGTAEIMAAGLRNECSCEVNVKDLDSLPPLSEGLARRSASDAGPGLDLTPDSWRLAAGARLFKKKMLVAAGLAAGVWILGLAGLMGGLYYQKTSLASLEAQAEKLKEPALEVRKMRKRVHMIRRYTDRSHSALECLREISVLLPKGVKLASFSYIKGKAVKIPGDAATVEQVYEFKNKLDGSKLFDEVSLKGPRWDKKKRKQVFDIEIELPGGDK